MLFANKNLKNMRDMIMYQMTCNIYFLVISRNYLNVAFQRSKNLRNRFIRSEVLLGQTLEHMRMVHGKNNELNEPVLR